MDSKFSTKPTPKCYIILLLQTNYKFNVAELHLVRICIIKRKVDILSATKFVRSFCNMSIPDVVERHLHYCPILAENYVHN